MKTFGLIGRHLQHSFSPAYFAEKFAKEGIENCAYELFPLEEIGELEALLKEKNHWGGLNVTIPYKTDVIPFLDELSPQAKAIGAVNTIQFLEGKRIGHNTDVYGFQVALEEQLTTAQRNSRALVLGTGGASKAVVYALKNLNIPYQYVSRTATKDYWTYSDLTAERLREHLILINTTPLGMSPNSNTCPDLDYEALSDAHLLFDLVYNPEETLFMQRGRAVGAAAINGLKMLHLQAEKAWAIWNKIGE